MHSCAGPFPPPPPAPGRTFGCCPTALISDRLIKLFLPFSEKLQALLVHIHSTLYRLLSHTLSMYLHSTVEAPPDLLKSKGSAAIQSPSRQAGSVGLGRQDGPALGLTPPAARQAGHVGLDRPSKPFTLVILARLLAAC
jgi:hypothetical protein